MSEDVPEEPSDLAPGPDADWWPEESSAPLDALVAPPPPPPPPAWQPPWATWGKGQQPEEELAAAVPVDELPIEDDDPVMAAVMLALGEEPGEEPPAPHDLPDGGPPADEEIGEDSVDALAVVDWADDYDDENEEWAPELDQWPLPLPEVAAAEPSESPTAGPSPEEDRWPDPPSTADPIEPPAAGPFPTTDDEPVEPEDVESPVAAAVAVGPEEGSDDLWNIAGYGTAPADHLDQARRPWLAGLTTRWAGMRRARRVNVVLYALTALSIVAMSIEFLAGPDRLPTDVSTSPSEAASQPIPTQTITTFTFTLPPDTEAPAPEPAPAPVVTRAPVRTTVPVVEVPVPDPEPEPEPDPDPIPTVPARTVPPTTAAPRPTTTFPNTFPTPVPPVPPSFPGPTIPLPTTSIPPF